MVDYMQIESSANEGRKECVCLPLAISILVFIARFLAAIVGLGAIPFWLFLHDSEQQVIIIHTR